jgi:hypothetical protein
MIGIESSSLPTGSRKWWGLGVGALAALLVSGTPSVAHADDIAARNLAEQMFTEGRKLMGQGKFDEACPKLAESQRLDPGGGTILNLAVCHEGQGRFASAWSEFKEAIDLARTDGRRDREQLAIEHLAEVEPKVSHLTFAVDPNAEVSGLTIKLDGQAIGRAAWTSSLPVDPGAHDVLTSAPGKVDRRVAVQVLGNADTKSVPILPLEDAPAAPSAGALPEAAPEVSTTSSGGGKKVAGFVVGGVGIAALAVGTVFGVEALQKRSDSDATCSGNGNTCRTQAGVDANKDAQRFAIYSDVGLGVGVVGLVVGAYLVLSSAATKPVPASTATRFNVLPTVGARESSLALTGTW